MSAFVKRDGVPLYVLIRKSLQDDIAKNFLVPRQKKPLKYEPAIRLGISRMTVRRGISELIDEGLLCLRLAIATFKTWRDIDRDHTRLESFKDFSSFIKSAIYTWRTAYRSN
jgi:GntR family transcriptional regulator